MSDSSDSRTTVENVRLELEADGYPTAALTDAQVTVVGIEPAHLDVEELLAGGQMSDKRLALIERYLAGHNILNSGIDDLRQADDETRSDGSSTTYAGDRNHADYRSTSLGQKAIKADLSDTLVNAHKPSASFDIPSVR